MGDFLNLSKYKMEKANKNKATIEQEAVIKPIEISNIKLLSTNIYYFKTVNYKNMDVCIYKNAPADNKDYYLVLTENKNTKYYIKSAMLDNLDNTQDFKNVLVKDLYFYKTVNIENYYNIYKNLKADIYKDVPDEELDNFDHIWYSSNGYYYIHNNMFIKYSHLFSVLPIIEEIIHVV